jgi:hypothetical protein
MHPIRRAVLLAAATVLPALPACGGSSDTAAGTPGADAAASPPPVGIFDVDYGQFSGTYAFLADGSFYGVHFVSGSVLAGHPHGRLSAANATTAMEPIAWANFIDDAQMLGAQERSGLFGRSLGADGLAVKISGSMGVFGTTARAQKTYSATDARTLYDHPLPMATLAGHYAGKLRTVGPGQPQADVSDFAIAADGRFSASAIGCSFSGTIAEHGSTGVFDVQAAASGCGFSAPLQGAVVPLGVAGDLPRLAVELDSADNQQTAVFIVAKQ